MPNKNCQNVRGGAPGGHHPALGLAVDRLGHHNAPTPVSDSVLHFHSKNDNDHSDNDDHDHHAVDQHHHAGPGGRGGPSDFFFNFYYFLIYFILFFVIFCYFFINFNFLFI
jgi:hypothetical protein